MILAVFIGLGSPIIVESFVEEKKYSSNKIGIDTQYIVNPKDICRKRYL
ncbi:peptidase M13 [Francisella tularensis subsp. holarctica]|nr:peptidase M13 [Francisella tularensis subsp. holarctica]OPH46156.1 peptidase M13 [Francisella tularensis subsp. holarctica]PLQ21008.1 peptidase M13 [Francisella tularensis subsp. holarctica]PLQ76871.1 peptidase M13 [Francisella tularensis subsp. holarctica]